VLLSKQADRGFFCFQPSNVTKKVGRCCYLC